MKKVVYFLITLLMIFFNSGVINAANPSQLNSSSLYTFCPVNKTGFDSNSVEYKVLGYQILKDPRPSANSNARYLLVKCQVNTDDLDQDEAKYTSVDSDFVKVYDNGSEAQSITDLASKKRLEQPPFDHVRNSLNHVKISKTYEFDKCFVVYPYDDLKLQFAPDNGDSGIKIDIHQVQSSNGVTMDTQDPLANYEQEDN